MMRSLSIRRFRDVAKLFIMLCLAIVVSCLCSLADCVLRPYVLKHHSDDGASPRIGSVQSVSVMRYTQSGPLHVAEFDWQHAETIWSLPETRWYVPWLQRPATIEFMQLQVRMGWPLRWACGSVAQSNEYEWKRRAQLVQVERPLASTVLWHDGGGGLIPIPLDLVFVPAQVGVSGVFAAIFNGIVWLTLYCWSRRFVVWAWTTAVLWIRPRKVGRCAACGYDVGSIRVCPECGLSQD